MMLVGAPLSGKTTVYRVLADAMNLVAYREGDDNPLRIPIPEEKDAIEKDDALEKEASQKGKESGWRGVDIRVVHPKSLTLGQLFGKVTNAEWQEGVLSSMVREMAADTSGMQ